MKDNKLYEHWKTICPEISGTVGKIKLEARFIELMWPNLIEQARATLTDMLTRDIAENLKSQIHEALVLDNGLRRGRMQRRMK